MRTPPRPGSSRPPEARPSGDQEQPVRSSMQSLSCSDLTVCNVSFFQPAHHPSGLNLVSPTHSGEDDTPSYLEPTKKKLKKSLNQAECLNIIREHGRNMSAAANSIVYEHFMTIPADEIPTTDLAEMEAVAEKFRKLLGEYISLSFKYNSPSSTLLLQFIRETFETRPGQGHQD